MRTVRDGVFGAIGRRRCTGQCVLGWTRVAPECGAGSALGVPQHSGHGGWGSDASNGGLTARGCLLAEAARCFLALGTGAVPLHRGARDARALGLRPERPAHFAFGERVNFNYPLPFLCSPFLLFTSVDA